MIRSHPLAQATAARLLAVLLPITGYAVLLALPQAGALGVALRYNLDLHLALVVLLLWLALLPTGRLGLFTGLAATLALFGLPLVGLWDSAAGEMHVLGGLLYFSDTAGFYWDANRLLEGGLFSAFAARRPVFPGLLAGLLAITGHNTQLTLAGLVGLCAVCCFLAARELRQTRGPAAGALLLLLLFLFYRRFIGMTDTENLGLALGALGFALLLRGARRERRLDLLAGALLLTLALVTRAGAFLALPALAAWAGGRWRCLFSPTYASRARERITAVVMVIEVIALGFVLNLAVFKATSDGRGSPFANSAYTLYGMAAGGKGWEQITRDAPEVTRLPEEQAAREINRMAWALIREQPGRFALTVLGQFADFFSLRDESVFGFASGADVVIFDAPRPENAVLYRAARGLLAALSLLGLFAAFRRKDAAHSLLLYLACGAALSAAFLPPRDAGLMRVYAATMPVLAAIPAIGLGAAVDVARRWPGRHRMMPVLGPAQAWAGTKKSWLIWGTNVPQINPTPPSPMAPSEMAAGSRALTVFGLALAGLVIAAPLAVRVLARPPALPQAAGCLPGEEVVFARISRGAYLRLVEDGSAPRTWLPEVRISDFRSSLQSFPHSAELAGLEAIQPPARLQNAVDPQSGRAFWLVLQGDAPPEGTEVVPLCGNWSAELRARNYDFFFGVLPEG